jgi:putative transposase
MSLNVLRRGCHVKIGATNFVILRRLNESRWQLENTATGEWCAVLEDDLLDRFVHNELSFNLSADGHAFSVETAVAKPARDLTTYPSELVMLAQSRLQYLKEIDRRQPIAITPKTMETLITSVSQRINDVKPPGWRTLSRDYRKWLAAGRDIRALIVRHCDRGSRGARMLPEAKAITDRVIEELYLTAERKRVPEVYLEIVRRLADSNKFRGETDRLPIPSLRTIYREIARKPPYEIMLARYGKRRAQIESRISGTGPATSRPLQRVSMWITLPATSSSWTTPVCCRWAVRRSPRRSMSTLAALRAFTPASNRPVASR